MSGALISPVDEGAFVRLLENLDPADRFAVAVSGGADSMALALCAQRWAKQNNKNGIALIVDHGMRAESAAEAQQVKTRLESIGLSAETLRWQPPSGHPMHAQAREARYHLLEQACRRHDIIDLWVAHHREDQAETIVMRLAKGSGVEGLAGMSRVSRRGDIRILRPFLTLSKQRLIATCQAAPIDFVTDPSNASEKYARGRLRKIMPLLQPEGLTIDSLVDLGERAAEANEALDFYTTDFLHEAATTEIGGSLRIVRERLASVPRAIALRALAACLRYIDPDSYAPERASLSSLLDAVIDEHRDAARTFYGCIISLAPHDAIIMREPAAATEILPFDAGATLLWDKRWRVTADKDAAIPAGAVLRALGNPPHDSVDALAPDLRRLVPQGRVRATLPALWQGDNLCAIPVFDEKAAFRLAYRKQSFP